MSNIRIACIGALISPGITILFFMLGLIDKISGTGALIQAQVSGARLAVALFGK